VDVPCELGNGVVATSAVVPFIPDGTNTFGIAGRRLGELIYVTHSPVAAAFASPGETDLTVDAESTP